MDYSIPVDKFMELNRGELFGLQKIRNDNSRWYGEGGRSELFSRGSWSGIRLVAGRAPAYYRSPLFPLGTPKVLRAGLP